MGVIYHKGKNYSGGTPLSLSSDITDNSETTAATTAITHQLNENLTNLDEGKAPTVHKHNPGDLTDGYTNNSIYIDTHPEGGRAIIPFINNDIAYLTLRGGSAKVYYDGVEQSDDTISKVFDGTPSYWFAKVANVSEIVIELTLHKAFRYSSMIYASFGSTTWKATNIKIDAGLKSETTWNNVCTLTGYTSAKLSRKVEYGSAGFDKIRFTFSGWGTGFRIAEIGIMNYESLGVNETHLSKAGGEVYGPIIPFLANDCDFGSNSRKWRTLYTNRIQMANALTSTLISGSWLSGNKGNALINSDVAEAKYVALIKANSKNGYFVDAINQNARWVYYTDKETVDAEKNEVTKALKLLDEDGNSSFPGSINAKNFSGPLTGNASSATKLQTPRKINGVDFDGSKDVEIGAEVITHKLTNEDLDNVTTPGFYVGDGGNTVLNKPEKVRHFGLLVYKTAAGYITQELTWNNRKYIRCYYNGTDGVTWSAWGDIYTSSNKPTDNTKLPLTGGEITGDLVLRKGHYVHNFDGVDGEEGYVKFAQLIITKSNANAPLIFEIVRRGTTESMILSILFTNSSQANTKLLKLIYNGAYMDAFAVETEALTWSLYVKKQELHDHLTVSDFKTNVAYMMGKVNVIWTDEQVATIPEGAIKAEPQNLASHATCLSDSSYIPTSAGSETQPVYFKDGKPVACKGNTTKEVTLSASAWSGTTAPYTLKLSVVEATATNNIEISPSGSITVDQYKAMKGAGIINAKQEEGSITLKAFESKPTIDIPIRLAVRY